MRLQKSSCLGTAWEGALSLRRLARFGVALLFASIVVVGISTGARAQQLPTAAPPGAPSAPVTTSQPSHPPAAVPQASDRSAPPAPVLGTVAALPGERPWRLVSVTLSPIHLVFPVVELTGELRLAEKFGAAIVFGSGSVKPKGETYSISVYEIGIQARYYLVGDFRHGMQLGAELLYLKASASQGSVSAVADGTTVGPFVGYKIITYVGFTFDAQLGFQRIIINASDSGGATASDSKTSVLLNLNIGWSF